MVLFIIWRYQEFCLEFPDSLIFIYSRKNKLRGNIREFQGIIP